MHGAAHELTRYLYGAHVEHILEGFLIGLVTAAAAAIVAGVVGLLRFIRRTDQARMDSIAGTTHRQWHVIRWAKAMGRLEGHHPFPLPDDVDNDDEWDEGLK